MSSTILNNTHLCVRRGGAAGLADAVTVQSNIDTSKLEANQIVLKVEQFGFSANNITYGQLGEHPHFNYFDFHPVPKTSTTSPKSHGIIPVWGLGTVVASNHPQVSVGRRVYGYLGMSKYVVLQLDTPATRYSVNISLDDMPKDRRPYKQLTFCDTDDLYDPNREDELILYLPLYWTSYWMEDQLNEKNYHGADTVLISSASSKTAFLLAYRIFKRRQASKGALNVKIIALTSSSNVAFTKGLGFYDEVYTYDQISQVKSAIVGKCLYEDVSGNTSLNSQISSIISPFLTITLGMTSVEDSDATQITGEKGNSDVRESFFMPEWLAVRLKQLTGRGVKQLQRIAWAELMQDCPSWVRFETSAGDREVLKAYQTTLKGRVGPDVGQMFTLFDKGQTSAKL